MKITVYNSKGGTGKTPIATNIALERDTAVATNEAFPVFESFISDERLVQADLTDAFPDYGDHDVVFDLAGTISETSHSITTALLQSDIVLVPTFNEVKALVSTQGTLTEILALEGFNAPILVIATKLQKGKKEFFKKGEWHLSEDYLNIKKQIDSLGKGIPVLPLKLSKIFDNIFEHEKSIGQLHDEHPLSAYTFKEVYDQFNAIFQHIDENTHAK